MVRVAVFTGEPSGDLNAAALLEELDALVSPCPLVAWGIGGSALRGAGAQLLYDSSRWGAMGIAEALKKAPGLLLAFRQVCRELRRRRPDLVILVDFGAFNARVGRFARGLGIPVFYYFPPGSWRRTAEGAERLAAVADRVVTPFPWSARILRDAGIDAHFVGHPLVERVAPGAALPGGGQTVCYLPGSRTHEVRHIGPTMAGAARLLAGRNPELRHVVVRSSGVAPREFERVFVRSRDKEGTSLFEVAADRAVHEVLAASDVVVAKAGTVTLEAAVHQKPMVVLYRGSLLQELEYRLLHAQRVRFIAMPNILADRAICPELIQREASPERVAALAWELLTEPSVRERQRQGLREVAALLGPPGATGRAARLALSMIDTTVRGAACGVEGRRSAPTALAKTPDGTSGPDAAPRTPHGKV